MTATAPGRERSEETARERPPARARGTMSWALAACALVAATALEKAGVMPAALVPPPVFVGVELALGVLGAALGVLALRAGGDARERRTALFGTAASVVVIAIVVSASLAGAASNRQTAAALRRATEDALHDRPGWNGGALLDGLSLDALEVDPESDLATILARGYDRPCRFFLLGADNRAGTHDAVIDAGGALAHRVRAGPSVNTNSAEPIRVPAHGRLDAVPLLFPPEPSFRDVDWIEIRVDGVSRRLAGRYFTVAEKHAIDGARAAGSK
jgi:hypothetical protein